MTRLGIALAPAVLLLLAACSGSASFQGENAPTGASKADFCHLMDEGWVDDELPDYLRKMALVGTPSNIPAAARKGFELLVDTGAQAPKGRLLGRSERRLLGPAGAASANAFAAYVVRTC